MRQLDTSDQRKYQGSSERCNEQLKLAQERGMSQSVRRGPPLPYNLQCAPCRLAQTLLMFICPACAPIAVLSSSCTDSTGHPHAARCLAPAAACVSCLLSQLLCRAMPSAPSQSGPSMGGTGDWQRLLSHSGPAGIGPASPGGSPVMNPMGGPSWVRSFP